MTCAPILLRKHYELLLAQQTGNLQSECVSSGQGTLDSSEGHDAPQPHSLHESHVEQPQKDRALLSSTVSQPEKMQV